MIQDPMAVLAVLLGVLAGLFFLAGQPLGARFFKVFPLLVFAYFVPTTLSNTGVIPIASPAYDMIKTWMLPASLLLLTMSIDLPAILKLGAKALALFLAGTATIVLGGPLAYYYFGSFASPEMGDQTWKGLAALSGSWIGGGANFVAIGESVGATESTMGMMVVVDVALANVWMACLLFSAGHAKRLDAAVGADRSSLEELRSKVEAFQKKVTRSTTLSELLTILFLAIGGTAIAAWIAPHLPDVIEIVGRLAWTSQLHLPFPYKWLEAGEILGPFACTVILVTSMGVTISFTPLRNLEGAGASKIGSTFLYLLVASIGAKAEFAKILNVPGLMVIGAVWIIIHAVTLVLLRYVLKAPVFYMAVGSQANIGGAASAPVVASAFHPSLAPVGALMGVGGYVLGTYAGLLCALLLRLVYYYGLTPQ